MGGEDALQIIIRGFQDTETGNAIIRALNNIGFVVKNAVDGKSDSMGGIIETHITDTDELTTDNLGEIREAIYAVRPDNPGIFVEYNWFYRYESGLPTNPKLRFLPPDTDDDDEDDET